MDVVGTTYYRHVTARTEHFVWFDAPRSVGNVVELQEWMKMAMSPRCRVIKFTAKEAK